MKTLQEAEHNWLAQNGEGDVNKNMHADDTDNDDHDEYWQEGPKHLFREENERKSAAKRNVSQAQRDRKDFSRIYWFLLMDHIRILVRARSVSLYRVREHEGIEILKPEVWVGDWEEGEIPRTFERGKGIAGKAWENQKVYVSEGNVQEHKWFEKSTKHRAQQVRSILCAPIFNFDHEVIAVLNLDSRLENRFSERQKTRMSALWPQVYKMLKDLGFSNAIKDEELISVYFWVYQKAIAHEIENELSRVDPDYANKVFEAIYNELGPAKGKPGPKPVRLLRVWEVFKGRENEPIRLEVFAKAFKNGGTEKEARKNASSAISWLNNIFKRWGKDIEIETTHCTTYQLRMRSQNSSAENLLETN